MVKPDVTRDYYADLGVGPNADQEEIKKQFRRLALKYHPDRNPGKEAEYNSKFQAIQAAHEILVDSQLRLKYDTGRLRAGYGKLYGPPRTATPTRQAPPQAARKPQTSSYNTTPHFAKSSGAYSSAYPPPPSNGAQKFASYAKAGAQKFDKVFEESRARAEAFQGFQDMKNKQPQHQMPGGWTAFDPRTGRSTSHENSTSKPRPSQHHRGQSAYHAFAEEARKSAETPTPDRAKATKAKNGFAPRTAGGDEPMAKCATSYYNVRNDRPQATDPTSYFYEPAPSPTAKKQHPAPDELADPIRPNLQRTSGRYATLGGEKTYMPNSGINRSTSVREETSSRPRTNPPSPVIPTTIPSRHHSASPKLKPDRQSTFSVSSSSSKSSSDTDDTDEVIPNFRPKVVPRSRLAQNKPTWKPSFPDNKPSGTGESPFGWAMGPDSWLFAEIGAGPSQPSSTSKKWDWEANIRHQEHGQTTPKNGTFGSNNAPYPPEARREPSMGRTIPPTPNVSSLRATPADERRQSASTMYDSTLTPKPSARHWSEKWGFSQKTGFKSTTPHPLWAYPANILPSTYTSQNAKESEDGRGIESKEPQDVTLNTDSAGKTPLKNLYGNKDPSTSAPIELRADNLTSTHSFDQTNKNETNPLNGFMRHTKSKSKSHESFNASFSPSEWKFAFSPAAQYFTPHPTADATGTSPKKYGSRQRSRSRPTTSPSNESPGKAHIFKEMKPSHFKDTTFSAEKLADGPNDNDWAMPTTENSRHNNNALFGQSGKEAKKRTSGPKPVSISSEAEEEDATTYTNQTGHPLRSTGLADEMDVDEELPTVNALNAEHQQGFDKPKFSMSQAFLSSNNKPRGGKKESFSLKRFTLVSPFTSSNSKGIDDLKDLNSSLPFKSEASSEKPSQRPIHPRDLSLPKPPKPPTPPLMVGPPPLPRTAIEKHSLPPTPWEVYMVQMQAYMREWNSFNRTMLAHFNERQNLVEGTLAPGWMRAMGDSGRVKLDGADDDGETGASEEDSNLVGSRGKSGYSEYLRGIEEDFVVRQHWDVAWERHRESILDLGKVREWLRSGHGNAQGGFQAPGLKTQLN